MEMSESPNAHVLIVPLGNEVPSWSTISWREIVNDRRMYFHPIGKRQYPKSPASWLGFRYDGTLQSVHAVKSVIEIPCLTSLSTYFKEIDGEKCRATYYDGLPTPHFLYTLEDPVALDHVIYSGKGVEQGRKVVADLDLLLGSNTIREAELLTRERNAGNAVTAGYDVVANANATARSPVIVESILPPIPDAESLIDRIRSLAGLPERNHEDVVRELLIRLGHAPKSVVFQVGHIDVCVKGKDGQHQTIFEVKKSIASESSRANALRQANDYANRTGAELFVITDGDHFVIYDRRRGRSYGEMKIGEFRLLAFRKQDEPLLNQLRPANH